MAEAGWSTGRRLVLLHGFTGRSASWDAVVAALGRGARVETPELPGHGSGPQIARSASFEGLVDALARDLAAGGPRPFELAGYSMGARVALSLAVRHAALVRRLVLVGGRAGIVEEERPARRALEASWCATLREAGLASFLERWAAMPLFDSQRSLPGEVLDRQRRLRASHDPEQLARAIEVLGLAAMPDYTSRLGELTMPVELVVGERDARFRAIADRLRASIRGARLRVVAGAGHNVVLERPHELARILEEIR